MDGEKLIVLCKGGDPSGWCEERKKVWIREPIGIVTFGQVNGNFIPNAAESNALAQKSQANTSVGGEQKHHPN